MGNFLRLDSPFVCWVSLGFPDLGYFSTKNIFRKRNIFTFSTIYLIMSMQGRIKHITKEENMEKSEFRKLTSRILRHGGFIAKVNKVSNEYELFEKQADKPTLYCLPVREPAEDGSVENYLCFRVDQPLTEEAEKLYSRLINRFTRLAPSIIITFENELDPVFTDEQLKIIDELVKEYDIEINEGDETNEK